jgi:putative ABC transport system substrate-binding protein
MRRREVIAALGAAAWPLAVHAQERAGPVIGFLHPASSRSAPLADHDGLRRSLAEGGYVEGHNLTIEYRWGEGHFDRLPALAGDLVSRRVALVATVTLAARPALFA